MYLRQAQDPAQAIASCVKTGSLCPMTVGTDREAPSESSVLWATPAGATFAERLAIVRHRMQWNYKEAAAACAIAESTWRLWELGGALPRDQIRVCMVIATRTGCDVDWLVYGPNGKPGGSATITHRYVGEHVLSRSERPRALPRRYPTRPHADIHTTDPTRPVSQTRPRVSDSRRPLMAGRP